MSKKNSQIKKENRDKSFESKVFEFVHSFERRFWILTFNARPLIIFELLFKAFVILTIDPIISGIINLSLFFNNSNYVVASNFFTYITNPITILLIVLLIFFISFLCLIDINAGIFTFDLSRRKIKTSFIEIIKNSFILSLRMFLPKNWLIIPFIILIFPIVNMGTTSLLTENLALPSFIIDFTEQNTVLIIIMSILIIAAIFIVIKCLFSVHYFTLENISFAKSIKKSVAIVRGNWFKNILSVGIIQGIIWLSNALLTFLSQKIGEITIGVFGKQNFISALLIAIVFIAFFIAYIIIKAFFMPLTCWRISTLFYDNKDLAKQKIQDLEYKKSKNKNKKIKKRTYIIFSSLFIFFVMIGALSIFSISNVNQKLSFNIKKASITAYKGFTINPASYSLEAIDKAVDAGTNEIYEEIFKISDGSFVCYSHQAYTKILSKIGIKDGQVPVEKLKEINKSDISDAPDIKTIIDTTKDKNIKLLINIDTANLDDYELLDFVDEISKTQCIQNIKIESENYNYLSLIKKRNSNIYTIFRSSVVFGDVSDFSDADAIAVEVYNASSDVIKSIHKSNKDVYVWAVGSKKRIENTIRNGADNIVTKNVNEGVNTAKRYGFPQFVVDTYNLITN